MNTFTKWMNEWKNERMNEWNNQLMDLYISTINRWIYEQMDWLINQYISGLFQFTNSYENELRLH